jgi:PAS domain S-box-containing protein
MKPSQPHILVVDDDVLLLEMYTRVFERAEYRVSAASSAAEAMRSLKETKPDIVVLDVVLPDIDGVELCNQIKTTPEFKDVYILLVSGKRAQGNDRAQGLHAGADSYLTKPVSNQELLAHVESLVRLKQAEDALRQERDFLSQITESGPIAMTVVDSEGEIIFANPQAERVLGLSRHQAQGRRYNAPQWKITDYDGAPFPEEDLPFRQVMDRGHPVYDVRHAIEWPDGQHRLLSISGAPMFNAEGEINRAVFAISDLTSLIQAQAALRASEEKFRTLFRHSADAILIHEGAGPIREANQVARETLGGVNGELTTYDDLFTEPTAEEIAAIMQRVAGGEEQIFEATYEHPDGRSRVLEIISRAITVGGEKLILSTARDISARKAAEAAQLREIESLQAMSRPPMRGITAGAFGLKPLHQASPDLFSSLVSRYLELLNEAVEQRVYKVQHDISAKLRALSEALGLAKAGPRDVIELHVTALQRLSQDASEFSSAAYADQGRMLIIELMGFLTSYYRHRAYPMVTDRDGQEEQTKE